MQVAADRAVGDRRIGTEQEQSATAIVGSCRTGRVDCPLIVLFVIATVTSSLAEIPPPASNVPLPLIVLPSITRLPKSFANAAALR